MHPTSRAPPQLHASMGLLVINDSIVKELAGVPPCSQQDTSSPSTEEVEGSNESRREEVMLYVMPLPLLHHPSASCLRETKLHDATAHSDSTHISPSSQEHDIFTQTNAEIIHS